MIIVSDKNIENSVYFPQNIYTDNNDVYKLVLNDRGTNKEYVFDNLDDKHLVQYDFYSFFINFSSMPEGEYEYTIFDSKNDIVSKGLIRLNELEQDNIYYDTSRRVNVSYNKNNEYIAYDKQ